jgi:hypothetical protein
MPTTPNRHTTSGGSTARPVAVLLLPVGVWLVLASRPLPARADTPPVDQAVLDSITKLNKKALEQYDNLNFDEAQETLISALELCTTSGLDDHPIKARTLLHLGVVVLAGGPLQRGEAMKQFQKALAVQPDIVLTDRVANPEVQQAFEEAKAAFVKSGAAQAAARARQQKLPSTGLGHDPVTSSAKARPIPISVTVDASLGAKKVLVSFRAQGTSDFVRRDLKEVSPGSWSAVIPETATGGDEVAYMIRAENGAGEPIAGIGSPGTPLVVKLGDRKAGAPANAAAPTGEAAEPEEEESPEKPKPVEPPDWFLGLGVGTGFGWASGYGDLNNTTKVSPGFGMAKLGHALPEVGYFINPDLLLSLQVRWQAVSGATAVRDPMQIMCGATHVCEPATGALAVFGRLTWLFGDRAFHPYLAAFAGAGQIRHLASFPNAVDCGSDPNVRLKCVDTVAAGPILLGPGGGFFVNVSHGFALTLGVNTLVGFPTFTFHVDINAGVAIEL